MSILQGLLAFAPLAQTNDDRGTTIGIIFCGLAAMYVIALVLSALRGDTNTKNPGGGYYDYDHDGDGWGDGGGFGGGDGGVRRWVAAATNN